MRKKNVYIRIWSLTFLFVIILHIAFDISGERSQIKADEKKKVIWDKESKSGKKVAKKRKNLSENLSESRIRVNYRSAEDIRSFINKNRVSLKEKVQFEHKPKFKKPYSRSGKLSKKTLSSALNLVNQIRYVAGLSYDIVLDHKYSSLAQAASYVNHINEELSHFPAKPHGMNRKHFDKAAEGARNCNLSMGYDSINDSIMRGYMEDADPSNIECVGHRRWILNPKMGAIGFGYAGKFSALYATDFSNKEAKENGVAWPARTMPIEFFSAHYPWSLSFREEIPEGVQVRLVRQSDGKEWLFSKEKSDGFFNISNEWYGQFGCIIFRPDHIECYKNEDVFQVTVSGFGETFSYQVAFFQLFREPPSQAKKDKKH